MKLATIYIYQKKTLFLSYNADFFLNMNLYLENKVLRVSLIIYFYLKKVYKY